MAPKILVVDRNQAFATMLKDMLEADGGYEVGLTHAGSDALVLLAETDFDLTIVDMDLDPDDVGYRQLAHSVRQVRPTMRLMLIPMMGEELEAEARELDIQGTLSNGGSVSLVGFGTFSVKARAARAGRNPRTGETIQIPASNVPGFKAGKGLKDAVN